MAAARLATTLKRTGRRTAAAVGLDVRRHRPGSDFARLRQALLDECDVAVAVDVGASEGLYAEELRAVGFHGRLVSFEPLDESYARLAAAAAADPLWETMRIALGAEARRAELHVSGHRTSSSLLEMTPGHVAAAPDSGYVATQGVDVRPLDDVAVDLRLAGRPLFLKLDVQGSEEAVLSGAARTLPDVRVAEMELSFTELYRGQVLFTQALDRMRARGFVLVGLEPVLADPQTQELLQVNALFRRVRDDAGTGAT